MTISYFALPTIIDRPGETVQIDKVSKKHDYGCLGTYENGPAEAWHKSGRLYAGTQSLNDIVQRIGATAVNKPLILTQEALNAVRAKSLHGFSDNTTKLDDGTYLVPLNEDTAEETQDRLERLRHPGESDSDLIIRLMAGRQRN
jgi:hypothetical protein